MKIDLVERNRKKIVRACVKAQRQNSNPSHTECKPAIATATPVKAAIAEQSAGAASACCCASARDPCGPQGKNAVLDAATLSVNPQGALVVMRQNLPAETQLVLEHSGTRERVACKVARPPRETCPKGFTPRSNSTRRRPDSGESLSAYRIGEPKTQ